MWLHLLVFPEFPYQQSITFSWQTKPKNFTSMHMLPSHLQAFSSYTALAHTPLLSLSSLLVSKNNSLCPHTLQSSQLCFLTCCTSLIHLLLLCIAFLRGCSFFCTALSLAQLLVLPPVWEEKPKCPTATCATSPAPTPSSSSCHLPHSALLYGSRSCFPLQSLFLHIFQRPEMLLKLIKNCSILPYTTPPLCGLSRYSTFHFWVTVQHWVMTNSAWPPWASVELGPNKSPNFILHWSRFLLGLDLWGKTRTQEITKAPDAFEEISLPPCVQITRDSRDIYIKKQVLILLSGSYTFKEHNGSPHSSERTKQ